MDRIDFDKIIEDYHRQVINIAYRFLNNYSDAEEIAQEVFLRAYKAVSRYKPQAKISTYLYKITKNLCLNQLRRRKLIQFFSLDSSGNEPDRKRPEIPDRRHILPEKELEESELKDKIYEALNKLPSNQRTAVILKRYEDLELDEIADILGCSVGAVKSLLHRARVRLKKELAPYVKNR